MNRRTFLKSACLSAGTARLLSGGPAQTATSRGSPRPSLVQRLGYAADEVKRESRAQIEKAIHMGIDLTHIDPHDGIMEDHGGKDFGAFAKLYGELAKEFNLPVRMPPTQAKLVEYGVPRLRAEISSLGVLMPDEGMASKGQKSFLLQVFRERVPGTVTEIYIHPAVEGPEVEAVRAKGGWWKVAVGDFQLFTQDRDELKQAIKDAGITLIGWREIRDLQRHG